MNKEHPSLSWLSRLSPADIERLVPEALAGTRKLGRAGGWDDAAPEQVFAEYVKSAVQDDANRQAIIFACRRLYGEALQGLTIGPQEWLDNHNRVQSIVALGTLVELSHPVELRSAVRAFFQLVLSIDSKTELQRAAAVACFAFVQDDQDLPLWETAIQKENMAGTAFSAILSINPKHPRVIDHLKTIWQKVAAENWHVDAAFLTFRAIQASQMDGEKFVFEVFNSLREGHPRLWEKIKSFLKARSFASGWIEVAERSISKFTVFTNRRSSAQNVNYERFDFGNHLRELIPPFYSMDIVHGTRDSFSKQPYSNVIWTIFKIEGKHPNVSVLQGAYTVTNSKDADRIQINNTWLMKQFLDSQRLLIK